jgi:hypothetical protein
MQATPSLTKKFTTKKNVALVFIVSAVILQLISIVGSILDGMARKKKLTDFESGMGTDVPSSTSAQTEIIFAVLQLVGLIGFGFAFLTIVKNPLHLQ